MPASELCQTSARPQDGLWPWPSRGPWSVRVRVRGAESSTARSRRRARRALLDWRRRRARREREHLRRHPGEAAVQSAV